MLRDLPGILRSAVADPGGRSAFVVVNVAVNLLFLARSYIAMVVLDYEQLGLVAVLQTVIALVSSLHFGLLNGGYRLLCSAGGEAAQRINALIYAFVAWFGVVVLLAAAGGLVVLGSREAAAGFVMLGAVAGITTLVRTWVTNQLIAAGELAALNGANLKSVAVSLLPLALIPWAPLAACVAAIVVQPIAFALFAMLARPELRPRSISMSRGLLRTVMQSGFLIFLTGVFTQLIVQAERWYVVRFLGVEALGHLYLAIVFVTVFQLVPSSLDSVFLPRLVKDYESRDGKAVARELRRLMRLCTAYCVAAVIAVWLLAEPFLSLVLPRYVPDLAYVYLVLPGLVAFTLAGPFGIVFNVLIRYRAFVIAYGGGVLLAASIFAGAAWSGGTLDLRGVTLVRSLVLVFMAAAIVASYFWTVRQHPLLAFHRQVPAAGS